MKNVLVVFFLFVNLFLVSSCEIGVDTGITDDMLESILGIECKVNEDCDNDLFVCVEDHCKLYCDEVYPCPANQWCNYKTSSCLTSLKGYVGEPCRENADCPSDTVCQLMDGGMRCTMPCTSEAECLEFFADGCCAKIQDTYLCLNHESCVSIGAIDGDEDNAEVSEKQENDGCQAESFRCLDINTVERCSSTQNWSVYRYCEGKQFCYKGDCISGDSDGCKDEYECCPNTFHCKDNKTVEKCRKDGSGFVHYQDCEGNDFCSGGECVDMSPNEDGDVDIPEKDEETAGCSIEEGCPDPDEYCFVETAGDPENTKGYCLRYCDLAGGYCPVGYDCKFGGCEFIEGFCSRDADCNIDEFCNKRPGNDYGLCDEYCFNIGNSCPAQTYCEMDDSSLNYGKCVFEECRKCSNDYDCSGSIEKMVCVVQSGNDTGCCQTDCNIEPDICSYGTKCCPDGRCGFYCPEDSVCMDCPEECECDPYYSGCDCTGCPDCDYGYYCDESTNSMCVPIEGCVNPLICSILTRQCCPGYTCSQILYGMYGYCI